MAQDERNAPRDRLYNRALGRTSPFTAGELGDNPAERFQAARLCKELVRQGELRVVNWASPVLYEWIND